MNIVGSTIIPTETKNTAPKKSFNGWMFFSMRSITAVSERIEPMINAGAYQVEFLSDGWAVRTKDRRPSAHYENTVAITENGVEILTL